MKTNQPTYIVTKLSKNVTEYRRMDFEDLVKTCKSLELRKANGSRITTKSWSCGINESLIGTTVDGKECVLLQIMDSSD